MEELPIADGGEARRRWATAASSGAVLGVVLQWWMLTSGTWNLFRWSRQSDFYDVQARALLDGTFAMDPRVLGIESFARGDQQFMYFGPVPALLRLPFVAVTRHLDGRLAALSMLVALGVTAVALVALGWRLRALAGTDVDHPVSGFEAGAVGITFFAMIGGSSLLYASSRTWVYHEAILWGVALTLCSIALLVVWITDGGVRFLIGAAVFAMLAILTRPSVGGGALAALGLVAARSMLNSFRHSNDHDHSNRADRTPWPFRALLASVVVVPLAVYSLVNWLKFRRLLGVPFDQQGYTLLSQQRRDMLEANGGTLFNLDFIPTNLVSYLRPDLVGLDGTLPFVQPRRPVATIGSPFYDLIDLTSGIPTTMPLLVVLSLVGVVAVVKRTDTALRSIWPLLVGCTLGTGAVVAIGYLANRYQSDFLPLLVVTALIGLPIDVRWSTSGSRRREIGAMSLAVGLVIVGTVANMALGYSYQRAYAPSIHPRVVASYLGSQDRVDGWLGDGALTQVSQGTSLPSSSRLGDIAIIGDCAGLYLSDGRGPAETELAEWRLAELSSESGASAGTVVLDRAQTDATPLVHVATATTSTTIIVHVDVGRGVMTTEAVTDGVVTRGPDLPLRTGTPLAWEAFADPVLGRFEVFLDGRFAVFTTTPNVEGADPLTGTLAEPLTDPLTIIAGRNVDGVADVADDATASIASFEVRPTVCERLQADLE